MICSLKLKPLMTVLDYLENVALDFMFLVLNLCPIQVVILLPLWIKLTMGLLLLSFLCKCSSFFSYVGGIPVTNHFPLLLIDMIARYFGYSANYNTQGASAILFLICSDLLNFLRNLGTMVITKESSRQSQSHFY